MQPEQAALTLEQASNRTITLPGPYVYVTHDEGLFWRANSSGYTDDVAEAGLYDEPLPPSGKHSYSTPAAPLLAQALAEAEERVVWLRLRLRCAETA